MCWRTGFSLDASIPFFPLLRPPSPCLSIASNARLAALASTENNIRAITIVARAMATVMAAKVILERASDGGNFSTVQVAGAIAGFIFEDSKSIRTSTVILASFNILAAFATAARIVYDCYWASKRSSRSFKAS